MQRKIKKVTSVLLSIAMLAGSLTPGMVFAEENTAVESGTEILQSDDLFHPENMDETIQNTGQESIDPDIGSIPDPVQEPVEDVQDQTGNGENVQNDEITADVQDVQVEDNVQSTGSEDNVHPDTQKTWEEEHVREHSNKDQERVLANIDPRIDVVLKAEMPLPEKSFGWGCNC